MSKLVIVAIPEQDDFVWQVSSEKVPHVTLLFLGDADANVNSEEIVEFVEHAATTISPFYMDADYRGTLGEDEADVIFFEKGWDYKAVSAFRDQLLTNTHIKQAYNSTEQFPEWTPHLTMGYPKTPAKTPERERRIYAVSFDRIGVWFGDYEGPEFRLERKVYDMAEVGMSSMTRAQADELLHYGVKGMKWGKRREPIGNGSVTVETGMTKKGQATVSTSGGSGAKAHPDAIGAAKTRAVLTKSGTNALSNKDLQSLSQRIQLERQVGQLTAKPKSTGRRFVEGLAGDILKQQVRTVANDQAAKQVKSMMDKQGVKKPGKADRPKKQSKLADKLYGPIEDFDY